LQYWAQQLADKVHHPYYRPWI